MSSDRSSVCLGFFSVVEHDVHGLFGGYLLLNLVGQPLEFHCTAPVKPNRAQQILYGPTLEPYLYGEQIGATLISASKRQPAVIFVEQAAALAVRQHVDIPTALLLVAPEIKTSTFTIGQNRLLVSPRDAADELLITQRLATSEELFDLREPFERIRSAIEEAQRTTSSAIPASAKAA